MLDCKLTENSLLSKESILTYDILGEENDKVCGINNGFMTTISGQKYIVKSMYNRILESNDEDEILKRIEKSFIDSSEKYNHLLMSNSTIMARVICFFMLVIGIKNVRNVLLKKKLKYVNYDKYNAGDFLLENM